MPAFKESAAKWNNNKGKGEERERPPLQCTFPILFSLEKQTLQEIGKKVVIAKSRLIFPNHAFNSFQGKCTPCFIGII